MRKILILSIFVFVIQLINAEWVSISDNNEKSMFSYQTVSREEVVVHFSLNGYELENVSENGIDYTKITYTNEGQFLEEGKPDLPRFSRLLIIPDQGEVEFAINSSDYEFLDNVKIYPTQTLQSESKIIERNFKINEEYYNSSKIFPSSIVELGKPAILRDYRVVQLIFNPFQYDPLAKKLKISKNIEIKVKVTGENGINQKFSNKRKSRSFEKLYRSVIINYDEIQSRTDDYQIPSYLFIYPDNSTVESYLQNLTDWKHKKGFAVTAVSTATTGTSNTSIKSYIQNAYDNWENPPEFICLVGDAGGSFDIPTWYENWTSYNGEGDHPYTQLAGSDILSDAFIGRLSFNSTYELQVVLSKILNYERNPYMGSTSWFNKALLVGDPDISGYSCVSTKKNIKEEMKKSEPNMNYSEIYTEPFVSGINSSLNSGVSFFNYRGWLGMSDWTNGNTDALNNGFMLPVAVIITCSTGGFEGTSDCRSERFLKAGTTSVPKGAVAAIGTATTGTHTTFNNCMDQGIFYGIFNDNIYNMGGALVRGKLNLYNNYPSNPDNFVDVFSYWNNLMGDPGMEIWTDVPKSFNATYDTQIPLGANYFSINVQDTNSENVENAWVTILKGNDEIFASGYTDKNGNLDIPINAASTGSVSLVVSKHNFKPLRTTIQITEASVFVNVADYIIDDNDSGTSSGNNDGLINPGETIELKVNLKNYGSSTAYTVNATLTTDNEDIVINDNSESFGNILANQSVYSFDDFDIFIPANILGGTEIYLKLTITDANSNTWEDIIVLNVEGAHLSAVDHNFIGSKSGSINPGETSEMTIIIKNSGTVAANNITGTLSCSDPKISILDVEGYWSNIDPCVQIENTSNTFEIQADDQIISGTQIPFQLDLTNPSGFDQTISFFINIGEVSVNDPLGPDIYGYYCYDNEDVEYNICPAYLWIEIDPNYGGTGTTLSLSDNGDTGAIQTVSLPFDIIFYGKSYNTVTICSNGWLAPGSTEQYSFMNWEIPGPGGPSPMIAAFWDDLQMSSGHVCYYTPPSQEYFAVEWSRIKNDFNGSEETFQAIIYNTSMNPTPTGDNEIKIQYKVVNNVDQGSYKAAHGEYATVGIEDETGTIGLEYTYSNNYPIAAKTLSNNMALMFTTKKASIVAPPQMEINVSSSDFVMLTGQTQTQSFQISNTGEADLVYNIVSDYQDSPTILKSKGSGGPDTYGYSWKDSNETGGPTYDWFDISGLGTEYVFTSDDQMSNNINIGFSFSFYENSYSQIKICSNGFLTFTSSYTEWSNGSIPASSEPNNMIAPFWDDLSPQNSGNVHYYHDAQNNRFIVQFTDVPHYSGYHDGIYTFQTILYQNGKILFQYTDLQGDIDTNTIGIENSNGSDGLQVVKDNPYVENDLAILFEQVIKWTAISPQNGIVPSGTSEDIFITANTNDLDLGAYLCNLIICSNDVNNNEVIIPVNLEVVDEFLNIPENISLHYSAGQFTLQWNVVTGASAYKIYYSDESDSGFIYWTTVSSNQYSFVPATAKKFFKIVAIN